MQWASSIVRVYNGNPSKAGKFIGTAFFVDSSTLLRGYA